MHAAAKPLGSLFPAVIPQLMIPPYQRPYCWQQPQLSQLWEDLVESELCTFAPRQSPQGESLSKSHYLGPIFTLPLPPDSDPTNFFSNEQRWAIVDGQQRLTTLYLLLLCVWFRINGHLRDLSLIRSLPPSHCQDLAQSWTQLTSLLFYKPHILFQNWSAQTPVLGPAKLNDAFCGGRPSDLLRHARIVPANSDHNALRLILRHGFFNESYDPQKNSKLSLSDALKKNAMRLAWKFLDKAVPKTVTPQTEDPRPQAERFLGFAQQIMTRSVLVHIQGDADQPGAFLFGSINATGAPLTSDDLIKNLYFGYAERTAAIPSKALDSFALSVIPLNTRTDKLSQKNDLTPFSWLALKNAPQCAEHLPHKWTQNSALKLLKSLSSLLQSRANAFKTDSEKEHDQLLQAFRRHLTTYNTLALHRQELAPSEHPLKLQIQPPLAHQLHINRQLGFQLQANSAPKDSPKNRPTSPFDVFAHLIWHRLLQTSRLSETDQATLTSFLQQLNLLVLLTTLSAALPPFDPSEALWPTSALLTQWHSSILQNALSAYDDGRVDQAFIFLAKAPFDDILLNALATTTPSISDAVQALIRQLHAKANHKPLATQLASWFQSTKNENRTFLLLLLEAIHSPLPSQKPSPWTPKLSAAPISPFDRKTTVAPPIWHNPEPLYSSDPLAIGFSELKNYIGNWTLLPETFPCNPHPPYTALLHSLDSNMLSWPSPPLCWTPEALELESVRRTKLLHAFLL